MSTPVSSLDARAPVASPRAEHASLRLAPIDSYKGFWLGFLRTAFRWVFGKVMLPLRVIFPRIPGYAFPHLCLLMFMERSVSLPRPLMHVLSMRVSRNNDCSFCFDAHQAAFVLDKPDPALLLTATLDLDDPTLDARTRAVMAYADEVVHQGTVSDATFAGLTAHFDERQVVEIVWVAAWVIFMNMLARPLGLPSDGLCALAVAKVRARTPA